MTGSGEANLCCAWFWVSTGCVGVGTRTGDVWTTVGWTGWAWGILVCGTVVCGVVVSWGSGSAKSFAVKVVGTTTSDTVLAISNKSFELVVWTSGLGALTLISLFISSS